MATINNGTVTVQVTGGLSPYQYTLLNSITNQPIPTNAYLTFQNPVNNVVSSIFTFGDASSNGTRGLQPGSYRVKIVDANLCQTISDILIVSDATPVPTATATPVPTATEVPPTATPEPTLEPTATEVPPTATPEPTLEPTATEVPPTATPEPTLEPTATEVPPTATPEPTLEPTATEVPPTATPEPTATEVPLLGYYFHGGNADYPYVQAANGLTDLNPGDLYYNDGVNPYAIGDLSTVLTWIINLGSTATYNIEQFNLINNDIIGLGDTDVLSFDLSSSNEYYYIAIPATATDLTSTEPQHLVDGGIETRAVESANFTLNTIPYKLYRLGGGSNSSARSITFSIVD